MYIYIYIYKYCIFTQAHAVYIYIYIIYMYILKKYYIPAKASWDQRNPWIRGPGLCLDWGFDVPSSHHIAENLQQH